MKMKISVIMSTYNGEKYIVEQLESILAQTFRPNEVLINDDRSTEGTVDIIENFIKSNHLENLWKISVNKESKGCARNFIEGAMCASGDIIFFSDQDDIWDKEKIELMMEGFQTIHDMTACYCLERYIDKNGVELVAIKVYA
jgi:glycosyltransferase involved in cell wall biosynthesis